MLNNRDGTNEKPRDLGGAKSQGAMSNKGNGNSTTLKESKSRHDKGMELYKAGKVSIGSNGLFKVSGYYEADTERMTCTCPDYKTRREPCKHIYAACLFVKNRGKEKIEGLNGKDNFHAGVENGKEIVQCIGQSNPTERDSDTHDTISKPFDRQSTITRLAVLNTATEILKTHRKPIEFNDIVSLAAKLEAWALGGGGQP